MKDYKDIDFAKIDTQRLCRRGFSEAIYCKSKTISQLKEIFSCYINSGQNILGTKATVEQFEALKDDFVNLKFNKTASTITLIQKPVEKSGLVSVCTGGTGDIPIAEEASETLEFFGSNVKKFYDIGIAGIHRLLDNIDEIKKANVIVAVAGMEGALGGVLAGMVDIPVIVVPTSVGYGASFQGLSALLTMINSCAEGMTVVNIDNGFGAGYSANLINRLISKGRN